MVLTKSPRSWPSVRLLQSNSKIAVTMIYNHPYITYFPSNMELLSSACFAIQIQKHSKFLTQLLKIILIDDYAKDGGPEAV